MSKKFVPMDYNRLAIKLFDHHAREYQEKYFDVTLYRESLDFLTRKMGDRDRVFEAGAGPGNLASYLLRAKPSLRYLATDLSPQMLDLARDNNPGLETANLDCRLITTLNQSFECVISGFCIPYLNLHETRRFIRDAHSVLTRNGLLFLSWTGEDHDRAELQYSSSGMRLFIHYHSCETIASILHGLFETIHEKSYLSYNNIDTDQIIIARKKS